MIFTKFNVARVEYLIKGILLANPTVLIDFFTKNKKILMLNGTKLDAIPKDIVKLVDFFIKLPEKSKSVAYSYFSVKYRGAETCSVEEAITAFLFNEYDIENVDPKKNIIYCWCLLIDLLSEHPNEQLLKYMSTEIAASSSNTQINSSEVEPQIDYGMLSKLISFVKNPTSVNLSEISDYELITLLGVVDQSIFEDLKQELLKRANNSNVLKDQYEPYINFVDTRFPKVIKSNIKLKKATKFSNIYGIDPESYVYFGFVSKIIEETGTLFIDPLLLINNDDDFIELSIDDRKNLFPDRSNIMWLSKGHKRVLSENQLGLFNITLKPNWNLNNKGSKYIVEKLISQVFPVYRCKCSSTEPQRLRSWLVSNQYNLALTHSYVLLDEKILIKPLPILIAGNWVIDFDKPIPIYKNATIFKSDGKYYVYESGSSDTFLDLSSSDKYFKELIKKGCINKTKLTDVEVSNLIQEFNAVKNGENAQKITEIIDTLEQVLIKDNIFSELIEELSKSEKIQSGINDKVEKVVAERAAITANLKSEVEQLQARKSNLAKEIKKEEDQQKKIKLSLSSDIKSIFDKGVEDGKKVLAEVALFQAIIGSNTKFDNFNGELSDLKPRHITDSNTFAIEQKYYRLKSFKPDHSSKLQDDFKAMRFQFFKIKRLFEGLIDACRIGLTPAFIGSYARLFANAFVNSLSVDQIDEFTIGPGTIFIPEISDGSILKNNNICILLKNFDISPMSLYGHEVIDLCLRKFLSGEFNLGPTVVLTFEDSGLGLDYPDALKSSLVIVDTDQIEFENFKLNLDDFRCLVEENEAIGLREKKQLFNVIRSLKVFEGIDDIDRLDLLCGFLQKSYFDRYIGL